MAIPTAFRESGIVLPKVEDYLGTLSWGRDELLEQMHAQALDAGIPIVSEDVGELLHLLVRMHRPKQIVEFGTAIGYSTVYMARALQEGANLTSFEIDSDRWQQATEYLSRAGSQGNVQLLFGDGRELVETVREIDFAFLDATKGEYTDYLNLVLERMPSGGVVVVDNALMSGTVAAGETDGHWSQESLSAQRDFNATFCAEGGPLQGTVLPVGDGVALGVKQ
jgi:predicted O-methyltransferase YrrM